jgi:hypothetical protein
MVKDSFRRGVGEDVPTLIVDSTQFLLERTREKLAGV